MCQCSVHLQNLPFAAHIFPYFYISTYLPPGAATARNMCVMQI